MRRIRKPLFIANWKMHKTVGEAELFFQAFNSKFPRDLDADVVIAPPFTLLQLAVQASREQYAIGAQDVFWKPEGAFTGEISARMLKDLHCAYVIIGHSERRQHFGETNEWVNRKVLASLKSGLIPVMCVGETLEQMQGGKTGEVVDKQIKEGLKGVTLTQGGTELVLAYEPVWAIGTGKADTPEQSNRTIALMREVLNRLIGEAASQRIRILYGGSVKPGNIRAFMDQPEIDGALVGGASLDPEDFVAIIESTSALS